MRQEFVVKLISGSVGSTVAACYTIDVAISRRYLVGALLLLLPLGYSVGY
jgi:hypothetical protein